MVAILIATSSSFAVLDSLRCFSLSVLRYSRNTPVHIAKNELMKIGTTFATEWNCLVLSWRRRLRVRASAGRLLLAGPPQKSPVILIDSGYLTRIDLEF